jgi:cobalt-zinc-cadmium efflux system protein
MGHDHRHHHGLGSAVGSGTDRPRLLGALALIVGYMLVEVVIGIVVGSLALISDAAHMLTDVAAIGLALFAARLAARPPRGGYTYGLKRAEILAAQANGLSLLLLAGWLGYEGVARLLDPRAVPGWPVLVTALAGVAVNLAAARLMARANRRSLNVEGAYQHVLTDLFAFLATAVAGLVILLTGFLPADPIAALLVALLMIRSGIGLLRDSGRVLLEAAPAGLDPAAIGRAMAGVDGVVEVHDLHVWEITSGQPALSAHVIVRDGLDCHGARLVLEELLREEYALTHTTLQVDHAVPTITDIAPAARRTAD